MSEEIDSLIRHQQELRILTDKWTAAENKLAVVRGLLEDALKVVAEYSDSTEDSERGGCVSSCCWSDRDEPNKDHKWDCPAASILKRAARENLL